MEIVRGQRELHQRLLGAQRGVCNRRTSVGGKELQYCGVVVDSELDLCAGVDGAARKAALREGRESIRN